MIGHEPVIARNVGRRTRAGRPSFAPADRTISGVHNHVVDQIDAELRDAGSPERAEHEQSYLKSQLVHYGASVPSIRSVAKRVAAEHRGLGHDELLDLVVVLWTEPVHERRMIAVELLEQFADRLEPGDIGFLERLLHESRTWALVDGLAASVIGPLVERYGELGTVLDRWTADGDFWIRRSALLALLGPLRRGAGDFERFSRYADAMLDDDEFFIRKAIGWVLRDTARKRPDLVFTWLLPRASRASGVTIREAIKPLTEQQTRRDPGGEGAHPAATHPVTASASSRNAMTRRVHSSRCESSPAVWPTPGTIHSSTESGDAPAMSRPAWPSLSTSPAAMSSTGRGDIAATASPSAIGGPASVNRSVTLYVSHSTPSWSVPRQPYTSDSHALSALTRFVAPSATTAWIRSSAAAAPIASSPPIDIPTAAMRASSTSGRDRRNVTAAEVSRSPYQPSAIARPLLRPWPRASNINTP